MGSEQPPDPHLQLTREFEVQPRHIPTLGSLFLLFLSKQQTEGLQGASPHARKGEDRI